MKTSNINSLNRQLPSESKLFGGVDRQWRDLMRKTEDRPNALRSATAPGVLEMLQAANASLDKIHKCLEVIIWNDLVDYMACSWAYLQENMNNDEKVYIFITNALNSYSGGNGVHNIDINYIIHHYFWISFSFQHFTLISCNLCIQILIMKYIFIFSLS